MNNQVWRWEPGSLSYVHWFNKNVLAKKNNPNIVFPSELSFLSAIQTQPSLDWEINKKNTFEYE